VGVVRAAEQAGRLPGSLRMLANFLEKMDRLSQLAIAPVIYPVILIAVVIGISGFSLTFIVPKFLDLFLELGMVRSDFPLSTRMTSALAGFVAQYWWTPIPVILVLLVIYLVYRNSPRMRLDADIWALWLPIFGQINRDTATARILGILGTSLEAGMPLHEAMAAAGPASGNEMMSLAMRRAADRARTGYTAAECFEPTGILSEGVLWHLRSAEKSGTLPAACLSISEYFLCRGELMTRRMTAIIEPILIILVGLLVGGLGYSMFLPLVGIISNLAS
jgi:type IV pilus assembly protein PilC